MVKQPEFLMWSSTPDHQHGYLHRLTKLQSDVLTKNRRLLGLWH